ncbi:vacuolar protein sorting 8 homolog (S. cerevisiae) [Nesidiocoris tenuis]|uniref:Vacuolar protein sorting 8 homolog (S. cerevisiae) n=1 Tax=Nesidiocoris tenuis TaxID=355587 RepID=A0ABN7B086_9HEMI|nr:vacuolar protein sorting 8 homolog (S. cerevisiae) [Nesidiocoris tenuis]
MNVNGNGDSGLSGPDSLDPDQDDHGGWSKSPVQSTPVKTPTRNSVLNDDESLVSEEDLHTYQQDLLAPGMESRGDTASINSTGSSTSTGRPPSLGSTSRRSTIPSASIMRHYVLRAVSSQLQAANEGLTVGVPSAMCAGKLIAVGTTRGVVICFDWSQRQRWKYDGERDQGQVTAMAINPDSTRILVGYARGMVYMLDAADARVLRVIPSDAHTYSTAVIHIKFTDSPALALLSDIGGSVFEIGLKRVLGVRSWDCTCVFSGSRGEVVTLEPLLLYNLPAHPLAGSVIVAMATLSKMMLVSLRPQVRILFTQSLRSSPTTLPLLSWQFVVIQVADSRVMDPVLAVARNDIIAFYQISLERSGRISCHGLQSVSLSYSLISCLWLTSRTVALIDTNETLHLLDVRSKQELESLDLSMIEIVYNSAAFKGLATGGNVSKAMALAGQRAVYSSVHSFGNQLLLIGSKTVHVISMRLWVERIDSFVKENRLDEALKLAMEFYTERGKSVLGLRGAKEVRQKLVKEKVIDTLEKLVDAIVNSSPHVNYPQDIQLVVEHCIELGQTDLLFYKLWDGLSEDKISFLAAIEAAILDGKLTDVPPEIMQRLVSYQESCSKWNDLETCIQRVEVTSLDLEQVMTICKRENLYSAMISVWNRAMNDYTSPLHELIPILRDQILDGVVSVDGRKLGNLLLVYIATCLSGAAGADRAETARQQVVRGLCSQHSQNANDDETCFPYIRTLLEFDTREFLNSLVISFSDASLSMQVKQRLVDIIIQVMTEGSSFKCNEVSWVLCTLNSSAVGRGLRVDPELYVESLHRLTTEDDQCSHAERQSAFLQLLTSGSLNELAHDTLLQLAKSAMFHQVCAVLYEMRGEYVEVVKCHLLDPTRRPYIFSYIEQAHPSAVLSILLPDVLQELLAIDAKKTGQLFVRLKPQNIPDVLPKLTDQQTYRFLEGMLEESDLDTEHMTRYVCLMCRFEPDKVFNVVRTHDNIELGPAINICQERGLDRATAVLLERSGDLQGAFNVLLSRLQTAIETNQEGTEEMTEELVTLAQRGNNVLDSKTSWLPLLMCLLKLNSHRLLQRVLSNADLNLVSELHLLLQHTNGTLGELRGLIMGLFVKCRDQRRMLEATKRIHIAGLHGELASVVQAAKAGCRSPSLCLVCDAPFKDNLCLFRCGHGFHVDCIHGQQESQCIQCNKD